MQLLSDKRRNGGKYRFKTWLFSGTPCNQGPVDIALAISVFERPNWADPRHSIYDIRTAVYTELGKPYRRLVHNTIPDPEEYKATLFEFRQDFSHTLVLIMIIRPVDILWFDEPIVDLPELEERMVRALYTPTTAHFDNAVHSLQAKLGRDVILRLAYLVYLWEEKGRVGDKPTAQDSPASSFFGYAYQLQ